MENSGNSQEILCNLREKLEIGPLAKSNPPLLTTKVGIIDRVTSFKLLGVHIDSTLTWATHVNDIVKKVTCRLYFLKQLKRAGLSTSQLVHYYIAVIRPVLEYCVPAWHYALTKAQSQQLEALQKRAIHIIFSSFTRGMPYMSMLSVAI